MVCYLKTQGTITATLTWVPDTVQDAPPPKVWLSESANASWSTGYGAYPEAISGSRSVSLGGVTDYDYNNAFTGSGIAGAVGKHSLTEVGCGGGFITRTCTISAEVDGSGANWIDDDGAPGLWHTSITVGGDYTVGIHAHPYNFRKDARRPTDSPLWANPNTRTPGTLIYRYTWDSTDGNRASLTNTQIDENVDYSGNAVGDYFSIFGREYYRAPDPPFSGFGWLYRNPTKGRTGFPPSTVNGADENFEDFHVPGGWFAFPHEPLRWTFDAKQVYEFHCSCMAEDEWRPLEDGPEAKVHTISRSFFCLDTDNTTDPSCWWVDAVWQYEVTKDSDTAWMKMTRFSPFPFDWGPW